MPEPKFKRGDLTFWQSMTKDKVNHIIDRYETDDFGTTKVYGWDELGDEESYGWMPENKLTFIRHIGPIPEKQKLKMRVIRD